MDTFKSSLAEFFDCYNIDFSRYDNFDKVDWELFAATLIGMSKDDIVNLIRDYNISHIPVDDLLRCKIDKVKELASMSIRRNYEFDSMEHFLHPVY